MRICMHSPSIPSAQRAKFDPAVAKTPRVRHLAVWGLEMNRRELEPNVIVQGFANCASSPLLALWWNPVRLYSFSDRGSARFHIHYDYLAAVELRYYPPPFLLDEPGIHTNKRLPPGKDCVEETVTYFNSSQVFSLFIFNGGQKILSKFLFKPPRSQRLK